MKRENIILNIEYPCSQDWESMAPSGIGKFCTLCSKTVADFTSLSDQQIIDLLQNKSTTTCIRINKLQQNRVLIPSKKRNNTPALYKFLSGLLLIGTSQNSIAANTVAPKEKVENTGQKGKEIERTIKKAQNDYGTIKIRLHDKATNEAIPFTNVVAYKDGVQVGVATTNMDGEAHITSISPGKYSVKAIYVGYQATEVIDVPVNEDKTTFLIIALSNDLSVKLDGVNIVNYQACNDFSPPHTITREDYEIRKEVYVIGPIDGHYEPETIRVVEVKKTKKWWQFWKKENKPD